MAPQPMMRNYYNQGGQPTWHFVDQNVGQNPLDSYPKRKPKSNYYAGMANYGSKPKSPRSMGSDPRTQQILDNRNKLNIVQSEKRNPSYADQQNMDFQFGESMYNTNNWRKDAEGRTNDTSWWSNIGSTLGKDGPLGGLKGWLDIGTDIANIGIGYGQLGNAREENKIAASNLLFQKDAFNKNYRNASLAYNANADMRNDWKRAQQGGPGNYTMDTLIPV